MRCVLMSISIHKHDSEKTVRETIQKVIDRKSKTVSLDNYFGKLSFNVDGLKYQKKLRDEWK